MRSLLIEAACGGRLRFVSSLHKYFLNLAFVLATAIGATGANAAVYSFTWTGAFTFQDSSGNLVLNTDATANSWSGFRTDVGGTLDVDTNTGAGNVTVNPFNFFGGGQLVFTSGTIQAIGDGMGNPGTLMVGNLVLDWNGNNSINMDLVWDASGLIDALSMGMTPGDVISGAQVTIGGIPFPINSVLPASDSVMVGPTSFPIGPVPMATTAYDLTGGGLPLIADSSGIGGSPQVAGPFIGASASLDIGDANSMHLVSITPSIVPIPAAAWLFGSGLLGLVGVARHSKTA